MAAYTVMKEMFATIYKLYVQKAERKNRTADEVDEILCWLTSYTRDELHVLVAGETTLEEFLENMPQLHANSNKITGVVCGIRVEEITDPLVRKMRYLDKLIDELAKGKSLEAILRK